MQTAVPQPDPPHGSPNPGNGNGNGNPNPGGGPNPGNGNPNPGGGPNPGNGNPNPGGGPNPGNGNPNPGGGPNPGNGNPNPGGGPNPGNGNPNPGRSPNPGNGNGNPNPGGSPNPGNGNVIPNPGGAPTPATATSSRIPAGAPTPATATATQIPAGAPTPATATRIPAGAPTPATVGTEAGSSSTRAPMTVVPRRGVRILLVDDDVVLLSMLSARLERDGFAVQSAASGAQALANIEDGWPDLVILDLMMPGMDGEELAARVKRQVDLPIIVLSAIADVTSKVKLIERWADDYITKPFDYEELLARIRRVRHRVGDRLPRREVRLGPDLTLILDRRECWVGGARVGLSPTETRVLAALVASLGDPVTTANLVARG